jgi:Ca2+/H+ antiporter, TMEM165/GDT1 family
MDLTALAVTFGTIFLVELPDKTFIATLVLSTRYRPLLVWLGVGLAFAVQTLLAVTVGALATLLPETLVKGAAALIFLVGAVVLFRTAPSADAEGKEQQEEFSARDTGTKTGLAAVVTSFVVLFTAEWGDLSQLLTISMVARFDERVSVYVGALAALLTVSGLAILAGQVLLRRLRLSVLHYVGATVCLGLAAFTLYEVLTSV